MNFLEKTNYKYKIQDSWKDVMSTNLVGAELVAVVAVLQVDPVWSCFVFSAVPVESCLAL